MKRVPCEIATDRRPTHAASGIHAGGLGSRGVSGDRVLKDLGLHRELEVQCWRFDFN